MEERTSLLSKFLNKYDVFLSFRGEDTRNNFVAHLRRALKSKGIEVFIDDNKIKRGKEISPELLKAIEVSSCSIIILSENYASSTWCLDELVKILDCKKNKDQVVIPIFYHVGSSDVRNQTGNFGQVFAQYKDNPKVENWRKALTEVAGVAGFDQQNNRDEATSIKDIEKMVSGRVSNIRRKVMNPRVYVIGGIIVIFLIVYIFIWPPFTSKVVKPLDKKIYGDDI